jgi:acetyl-CoA carboxylase biotin carboxyl carrier protein
MDQPTVAPSPHPSEASEGADPSERPLPPNGDHAPAPTDGVQAVLEAVRDSALKMLAGFSRPPTTLRIQAGDVTVEAVWAAPATPSSASTPTAAGAAADGAAGRGDAAVDDDQVGRHYVHAPTVGTFYRAPEPGAAPFAEVGDTVSAGQQVAIVETMKLMIPVRAERSGTIVEILRENGESVEHGERLFALAEPEPGA